MRFVDLDRGSTLHRRKQAIAMTHELMPTRSPTGFRFIDRNEALLGWGTVNEASSSYPVVRDFKKRIGRMDGTSLSFYTLSMLPVDVDIETMRRSLDTGRNFLQCAVDAARLTIEHVRPRDRDVWHDSEFENVRDILAHGAPDVGKEPQEIILMSGDRKQVVYAEEVFAAGEAVDIFAHYYRHGFPPPRLHKRTVEV